MAESDTPYRRWLGLAQNQPNHFQLLGVERGEFKPEVLRAAAEARLGLLKSFSDSGGLAERKALAEEIKLAYATLGNSQKREKYERQLGASESLPSESNPPLAIPVALPVALPSRGGIPVEPASGSSPAIVSADPLVAVAAIESRRRRQRKSGSRSWMVTGLAILLFLGGPLLVIAIIWLNSQGRMLAQNDEAAGVVAAEQQAEGTPIPRNKAEKPFEGIVPQPAQEEIPRDETDDRNPPAGPAGVADSQLDSVSAPPGKEAMEAVLDDAEREGEPLPSEFASASLGELQRLVWNDLRYRGMATSRKRLQLAKGVLTTPAELRQLAAVEELIEHVDGYWRQIVQSAAKMKTGDLKLGSESAGFIESTDRYVMLKLKGVSIKVPWEYLPPEYAVAIAEQAEITDIPSWRLAKSAGFLVSSKMSAEQTALIRQWLDESKRDGHEVVNFEWALNCRLAKALSSGLPPIPSDAAQATARKVMEELVPDRNIALNNVAGRRARIEALLNEAGRQADPVVKYVAIERAREQAIRLVDLPLCRELLESLATAFDIDVETQMLASANGMLPYVQSEEQAELVCEAILQSSGCDLSEFTKGAIDPKTLVKAEELARKQGLKSMLDRIRFLTGRE